MDLICVSINSALHFIRNFCFFQKCFWSFFTFQRSYFSIFAYFLYPKTATRRLAMLQTASIASGAFLALFLVLVLCLVFYVRWHQQQKRDRCNGVHEENGFDTVDGLHTVRTAVPELRPFGPHHQRFIPMSQAYSNNNNHR